MENQTRDNGDSFAFPVKDVPEKTDKTQSGWMHTDYHGLTKRELFAKDILCALISNSPQSQLHGFPEYIEPNHIEEMPKIALAYAEALLLALETQPAK